VARRTVLRRQNSSKQAHEDKRTEMPFQVTVAPCYKDPPITEVNYRRGRGAGGLATGVFRLDNPTGGKTAGATTLYN